MKTAVKFLIFCLVIGLFLAVAVAAQEATETPVPNQPEKIAQNKKDKKKQDKKDAEN